MTPPPNDDHPDLSGVAGEMRAEWRAEQEAATADAAAQRRYARTIADWLRDRMHAGDRVAVTVGSRTFSGEVDEVGTDLVALRDAEGRVEIHIGAAAPLSFAVAAPANSGGARSPLRRAFRDALLARDGRSGLLVGTTLQPDGVECTLLVSRDYVTLAIPQRGELVVPLAHVLWVRVRRP